MIDQSRAMRIIQLIQATGIRRVDFAQVCASLDDRTDEEIAAHIIETQEWDGGPGIGRAVFIPHEEDE